MTSDVDSTSYGNHGYDKYLCDFCVSDECKLNDMIERTGTGVWPSIYG